MIRKKRACPFFFVTFFCHLRYLHYFCNVKQRGVTFAGVPHQLVSAENIPIKSEPGNAGVESYEH